MEATGVIAWGMNPLIALGVGITGYLLVLLCGRFLIKTDAGWKNLDYIWLAVAVFGVIGACDLSKKAWYETQRNIDQSTANNSWLLVVKQGAEMANADFCRDVSPANQASPEAIALRSELDRACQLFQTYKVDRNIGILQRVRYYAELSHISGYLPQFADARVLKALNELSDRYTQLEKDEAKVREDDQQIFDATRSGPFTFMFPLILAVALGLRFAKVTGEVWLLPASKKRIAEAAQKAKQDSALPDSSASS